MKIAFLSPISLEELQPLFLDEKLPQGLPSSLFVDMIYYYLREGHEIILCTTDKNLIRAKTFKKGRITIFVAASLKIAKVRAVTNFKIEIEQMYKFLKKHPCDIYHAHWTYEFAMAALKVDPNKTLITIHDWAPNIYELYHDLYRNQRYKMNNKVMNNGYYFSAVSLYIEKEFKSVYTDKNIQIIPNYLSVSNKNNDTKKVLNNENPIIIAINNGFNTAKNAGVIIKAFKLIRDKIPNATLHMFGEDYEIDGLADQWAKNSGLQENVIFNGKIPHEEILLALNKSDILIHTSLEESFGMVILEAMQQKNAVIGGRSSGAVPWLLNEGQCGKLVNIENEHEVAAAAVEILQSPFLWERYIKYGLQRANNFMLENVATMYLQYYQKISKN